MSPSSDSLRAVTRLSTLLVLAAFACVLGFWHENRVLIALFESILALVGASWLYARIAAGRLAAARRFPPRAYEEDAVEVSLKLWNRSWLPLFFVEVRDWFPCDSLPEKRIVVQRLPARGGIETGYTGVCAHGRGRYQVGPLEVAVSDPLGLFRRVRVFQELTELVVYPRTFPIGDLGLRELQWRAPVSVSGGRAGHAATFLGVREYRPGDNIRHLHWPSTARWGRLVLKEFEQDTTLEVTCFLDLDQRTLRGVGRGSNIEQAVRIAASIAGHVTSRLCAFQLVADPGAPLVLPARPGRAQLIAVLDALARVRATGRTHGLDLVSSGLRLVGEGSAVVLLLNTFDADRDSLFAVLSGVLAKRAKLVVIALDDATFLPLESGGPARSQSGERLAALTEVLAPFGVEPIVVRSGDDLAERFANPGAARGVRIPEPPTLEDEVKLLEAL